MESVCSSSDSGVRTLSCCGHVSRCCTESTCLFAYHRCRSTMFETRFRSRAHVLFCFFYNSSADRKRARRERGAVAAAADT